MPPRRRAPLGNPYWDIVSPYVQGSIVRRLSAQAREQLVRTYCHTIIHPRTLEFIATHCQNGAVEIGCGTGYLLRLLADLELEVAGFDAFPPSEGHNKFHYQLTTRGGQVIRPGQGPTEEFIRVRKGGPEQAAAFPNHTLIVSWPESLDMLDACLGSYRGRRLIFIDEYAWRSDPSSPLHGYGFQAVAGHTPVHWSIPINPRKPDGDVRVINDAITVFERH